MLSKKAQGPDHREEELMAPRPCAVIGVGQTKYKRSPR